MRLDKFICKSTELNRAEASIMLQDRQVTIDNKVFTNGAVQVHENNVVSLAGVQLTLRPFRYLLLHKPADTLCSNVDENYPSIFNYIDVNKKSELHVVGRLDVDTTGLVLMTDDGSWTYKIITPKAQCEKYIGFSCVTLFPRALSQSLSKASCCKGSMSLHYPQE